MPTGSFLWPPPGPIQVCLHCCSPPTGTCACKRRQKKVNCTKLGHNRQLTAHPETLEKLLLYQILTAYNR
jgi:hypothetical protein